MSVERPDVGQMWAGARVGKDLSPAAPLPYVDRRGVARIGCAAVARVCSLRYRPSARLV